MKLESEFSSDALSNDLQVAKTDSGGLGRLSNCLTISKPIPRLPPVMKIDLNGQGLELLAAAMLRRSGLSSAREG